MIDIPDPVGKAVRSNRVGGGAPLISFHSRNLLLIF